MAPMPATVVALCLASLGSMVPLVADATPTPAPECGVKGPDDTPWSNARIVNGQTATECEWGWQVSLASYGWSFCGGTLISGRWVFTAAHCMGGTFDVIAGGFDEQVTDANEETLEILSYISHPSYNDRSLDHDFALLELVEDAPIGSCITTACLPDEDVSVGASCFITGWGTLSSGGGSPRYLQEAMVTILDNSVCNSNYYGEIYDSMVCAQGLKDGEVVDACQGDSGGPLVCSTADGPYVLHGATSWGYGCASAYYPGVWSRVNYVREWIDTTMACAEGPAPAPATPAPTTGKGRRLSTLCPTPATPAPGKGRRLRGEVGA